jgi:hypothetical protein
MNGMSDKRHLNPAQIDAALQGSAVAPGLESVSDWAAELRKQTATEISIDTAAAQISALAQTAAAANPGGAGYSALKPSPLERIRRRLVFGSLLSGIGAKVFAASVALATATGGVAATGSLPDAVQDPIATVYNSVGFDFPTSHDDDECDHDAADCEDDADDRDAPGGGSDDDSSDVRNDGDSNDGDSDDADDDSDDADDDDDQGDDGEAEGKKDSDEKPGKGLGRDKDKENPGQGDDDQGDENDDDRGDDENPDDDDDPDDDDPGDDDDGQDDKGGGDEE